MPRSQFRDRPGRLKMAVRGAMSRHSKYQWKERAGRLKIPGTGQTRGHIAFGLKFSLALVAASDPRH
jgi:hypothetical protein